MITNFYVSPRSLPYQPGGEGEVSKILGDLYGASPVVVFPPLLGFALGREVGILTFAVLSVCMLRSTFAGAVLAFRAVKYTIRCAHAFLF